MDSPQQESLSTVMGPAVTVAVLLSNYEKYGLSERVCYHFDLSTALGGSEKELEDPNHSNGQSGKQDRVCGVKALLEAVPTVPWHRLKKRQFRAFKTSIKNFNTKCDRFHQERNLFCHEPPKFPLRLNPMTRVFFAYERTRIAFCLDASPTLTTTHSFGGSSPDGSCCAMDRVSSMARTFFKSLIEPIPFPSTSDHAVWRPEIAITVIAVYPRASGTPPTSLLVRDFLLTNDDSAEILVSKIEEWALGEVETEIARCLSKPASDRDHNSVLRSLDTGVMPVYSSSLRDIIDVGEGALNILSSSAKPCIVVASDGRNLDCDGVVDVVPDPERVDIPLVVLDLSSVEAHSSRSDSRLEFDSVNSDMFNLLSHDPSGAPFPLYLSDDTEALYEVCRSTNGCFFDSTLLHLASTTRAGQVAADSPLNTDLFFSFKRHTMNINAIQWYTLFSLSPLSPVVQSAWGRLGPPEYIREKTEQSMCFEPHQKDPDRTSLPSNLGLRSDRRRDETGQFSQRQPFKTMLSGYPVDPVRFKGLLMVRVQEGYRVRQYGVATKDLDKVSVQFSLPLDTGTTGIPSILLYEISYKAASDSNHMVGTANIRIEMTGDALVVKAIKNELLHQGGRNRESSVYQETTARVCDLLRDIRQEDILQSYLSPLSWVGQLPEDGGTFLDRLAALSPAQLKLHFNCDFFDCMCTGQMPYERNDDDFLFDFRDLDDGKQALFDTLIKWSDHVIDLERCFLKVLESPSLPCYCVVHVAKAQGCSRLFTVVAGLFGISRASDRFAVIQELRDQLLPLKDVEALPKQLAGSLIDVMVTSGSSLPLSATNTIQTSQHNHARWELIKDAELMPLLMRRRREIGDFFLLHSSKNHTKFAKLIQGTLSKWEKDDPGDLVQYHLSIQKEKVVVDLYVECEGGQFFPFRLPTDEKSRVASKFFKMTKTLRKRDQECGRALRCRTNLLQLLEDESGSKCNKDSENACVKRLLGYASEVSRELKFFHPASGTANDHLQDLVEESLLSGVLGTKVKRLSMNCEELEECGRGNIFFMKYDSYTIGFIYLSTVGNQRLQEDGRSSIFRRVTYFTVGIGDLYNCRDDIADDDSDNDHLSEHLCVTEFADDLESLHRENFSASAFLALTESQNSSTSIHLDDLPAVLQPLHFVEVARVVIAAETAEASGDEFSKLQQIVRLIIRPLVGDDYCFVYSSEIDVDNKVFATDLEGEAIGHRAHVTIPETTDGDDADTKQSKGSEVPENWQEEGFVVDPLPRADMMPIENKCAPVFIKLYLDDEPASIKELAEVQKVTSLSAKLSVWRKKVHGRGVAFLPQLHLKAANELNVLLHAYVAEQTLERLRHQGPGIDESDLDLARSCLQDARDVVFSSLDVFFYSSKTDEMVAAQAPAGAKAEVEEGFEILLRELSKIPCFSRRIQGSGTFLIVDCQGDSATLPFWCFIRIRKTRGIVAFTVHHPNGSARALETLERYQLLVHEACHRVNQLLLLQKLHKTRTGSHFLIPSVGEREKIPSDTPFQDGSFACPIVYKNTFELFHRCATNPAQVALKLESTVLHIFAVSNCAHFFVYKDEGGGVFYMNLLPVGGGLEPDGVIELLVYGVETPGPSVTSQLKRLLQKRLMQHAVELLSGLLVKNAFYHWRLADLDFVRSFKQEWDLLEDNPAPVDADRLYEFPVEAFDPGVILLYFRQNLCGSSYFHPLNEHENRTISASRVSDFSADNMVDNLSLDFFYNNNPSKLDPQYKSTLTEKGAELSRLAGPGLALVKLSLSTAGGIRYPENRRMGLPVNPAASLLSYPLSMLRFRPTNASENSNLHKVLVSITGTALQVSHLHDWILLTLNQVLVAWFIERHLEREQTGLLRLAEKRELGIRSTTIPRMEITRQIEQLVPGLPGLLSVLDSSVELPHPAIIKAEYDGVIRSSAVATVALELIEKEIFDEIQKKTRDDMRHVGATNMTTIRLSRDESPRLVKLSWDTRTSRRAVALDLHSTSASKSTLQDTSIDCPEYLIFFRSTTYKETEQDISFRGAKLFEEVSVDDGSVTGNFSKILGNSLVAAESPDAFKRSFVFVLSVKRNRRLLYTYNWDAALLKLVHGRLEERNTLMLANIGRSIQNLQANALRSLTPTSHLPLRRKGTLVAKAEELKSAPQNRPDHQVVATTKQRRIIRRPKLVGKSIEGAAVHAQAASRARASSKAFRPLPPGSNTAGTTLPAKNRPRTRLPPGKRAVRQDKPKQTPLSTNQRESEELSRLKEKFFSMKKNSISRRPLPHLHVSPIMQRSLLAAWPTQESGKVEDEVINFLLSSGTLMWAQACSLPDGLSPLVLDSFLSLFALSVAQWIPGFKRLNCESSSRSVIVVSETRKVHNARCFVAIRICFRHHGASSRVLVCEGWLLSLPRGARKARGKNRGSSIIRSLLRDSMGFEKLAGTVLKSFPLERSCFDFVASLVEEAAMHGEVSRLGYANGLFLACNLIDRFSLCRQIDVLRSNYKVFDVNIFLRSYGDKIISRYGSTELLHWLILQSNSGKRRWGASGTSSACFRSELIVCGTHSTTFLSCSSSAQELKLTIICRSQGRNLFDLTFRGKSNSAITVADSIAIEAAGLIYTELKCAATSLYRDELWDALSNVSQTLPLGAIAKLLHLCKTTSIEEFVSPELGDLVSELFGGNIGMDLGRCLVFMQEDDSFRPWRTTKTSELSSEHVFFCKHEHVFVKVTYFILQNVIAMSIVTKEEEENRLMSISATKKILNYFLHLIWTGLT